MVSATNQPYCSMLQQSSVTTSPVNGQCVAEKSLLFGISVSSCSFVVCPLCFSVKHFQAAATKAGDDYAGAIQT